MKASELIEALKEILDRHGDLEVVSGLARSGFGEATTAVEVSTAKTSDGEDLACIDIVLEDESLVAYGGF